jgi:hypothetical protein
MRVDNPHFQMVLDLRLEGRCRNLRIPYVEISTYQTALAGVIQGA